VLHPAVEIDVEASRLVGATFALGVTAVAAATGLRRGEIGALTWDAIDWERGTAETRQAIGEDRKGARFIKVPKNERTRDRYEDQGLVFGGQLGGMLDLDAVSKAFAAIAKTVGIKAKGVSLHSLRHFVGSQSIVDGSDIRTVAALLGHSDPSTTLRV
jgi:integrase